MDWLALGIFAAFILHSIIHDRLDQRRWEQRRVETEATDSMRQANCHAFHREQNLQSGTAFALVAQAMKDQATATREYAKAMGDHGDRHRDKNDLSAIRLQQEELRGMIEGLLKK